MGTGPFAVPLFQALIQSRHLVLALVTRPIADPGHRRKSAPNPMRDCANRSGVPVLDFDDANDPAAIAQLQQLDPDVLVVCDYGQILGKACLATARCGGVNLHGSLLPRYRGAAPVQWAVYHGETTTGVSVIHMTSRLDSGPVLESTSLEIDPTETADALESRLAALGPPLVMRALERLASWDGSSDLGTPQDPQRATSARRLRKSDGQINWTRRAIDIVNQIRAFQPWPGSFTMLPLSGKEPIRVILLAAAAVADESGPAAAPGEVACVAKDALHIQTGQGRLAIHQLQPAGKKPQTIAEFLRGHSVAAGLRCLDDIPNRAPPR